MKKEWVVLSVVLAIVFANVIVSGQVSLPGLTTVKPIEAPLPYKTITRGVIEVPLPAPALTDFEKEIDCD